MSYIFCVDSRISNYKVYKVMGNNIILRHNCYYAYTRKNFDTFCLGSKKIKLHSSRRRTFGRMFQLDQRSVRRKESGRILLLDQRSVRRTELGRIYFISNLKSLGFI